MFKITVTPQFADTDALQHINNNAVANWFELGRNDIFKIFTPSLELSYETWELILVHNEMDYLGQLFFNENVEIRTYILHVGKSSVVIGHEAWQNDEMKVKGQCVVVNYDFIKQEKKILTDEIKAQLEEHLIDESEIGKTM